MVALPSPNKMDHHDMDLHPGEHKHGGASHNTPSCDDPPTANNAKPHGTHVDLRPDENKHVGTNHNAPS